jgi:hypothetical protein
VGGEGVDRSAELSSAEKYLTSGYFAVRCAFSGTDGGLGCGLLEKEMRVCAHAGGLS